MQLHSASQIAAQPVNVTTQQRDASNTWNSFINAPEINKHRTVEVKYGITLHIKQMTKVNKLTLLHLMQALL